MKPQELADAANTASALTGVNARHFEKDFYVTQALRAVTTELDSEVVFKGGTSLSKAYGLIDRFSEDIDLLIVPAEEGPEYMEKLFERMTIAAQAVIPESVPKVEAEEFGLMKDVRLAPVYKTGKARGVSSAIRLEAGRRGGPTPLESRPIRPMLVDAIAGMTGDEFAPFDVTVLHPARTLIEKMFAVTGLAPKLKDKGTLAGRQARHFYDIYHLLESTSPAVRWIEDGGSVVDIVRDCERISRDWFGLTGDKIVGSMVNIEVFTDETLQAALEEAYDRTCGELCAPRAVVPTWAEVRARVAKSQDLLSVDA